MADEHGYPDWQRLSQQQAARLYGSGNVKVATGAPVTLGPFYVGLYPAVTIAIEQNSGKSFTTVEAFWHPEEAKKEPWVLDEFTLPEQNALFVQQLVCVGPWLTIVLEPRTGGAEARYQVLVQPNSLIYGESRLGDSRLCEALTEVKAGASVFHTLTRLAPGRGLVNFASAGEKPTLFLFMEYFSEGVWKVWFGWSLVNFSNEMMPGGGFSRPVNFPRFPVRFQVSNAGAANTSYRLNVSFP